MAVTRFSDIVIPAVWNSYRSLPLPEVLAFTDSGIAVPVPEVLAQLNGGGEEIIMPFWRDLDPNAVPNMSDDDPDRMAVPLKVGAATMRARKAYLNQGWSASSLTRELAGSDPLAHVRARDDAYWSRRWQRRLISVCKGLLADNIAANGGDMVVNVSIADGNAATDANLFSRQSFARAIFGLGDQYQYITAIAVHSVVLARMVANDDIVYIRPSQGTLDVPTFMGKRVIVDDGLAPTAGGTSGFVYTSILFGQGAIGYANGVHHMPVEEERSPRAGHGGGVDTLWTRKNWLIHPFGYDFTNASITAPERFATDADLEKAVNWTRMVDRKQVPIAFLQTNG